MKPVKLRPLGGATLLVLVIYFAQALTYQIRISLF